MQDFNGRDVMLGKSEYLRINAFMCKMNMPEVTTDVQRLVQVFLLHLCTHLSGSLCATGPKIQYHGCHRQQPLRIQMSFIGHHKMWLTNTAVCFLPSLETRPWAVGEFNLPF